MLEQKKPLTIDNQLKLIPISLTVVDNYVGWFNDPDVRKFLDPATPRSREEIEIWIKELDSDPSNFYFSIIARDTNVGHVGLKQIDRKTGTAEIGIVIGNKQYWGKGIGKRAIETVKTYSKDNLHLSQLTARVNVNNTKSIMLFKCCGFEVNLQNPENLGFVFRL